jgi:hypothetical protein
MCRSCFLAWKSRDPYRVVAADSFRDHSFCEHLSHLVVFSLFLLASVGYATWQLSGWFIYLQPIVSYTSVFFLDSLDSRSVNHVGEIAINLATNTRIGTNSLSPEFDLDCCEFMDPFKFSFRPDPLCQKTSSNIDKRDWRSAPLYDALLHYPICEKKLQYFIEWDYTNTPCEEVVNNFKSYSAKGQVDLTSYGNAYVANGNLDFGWPYTISDPRYYYYSYPQTTTAPTKQPVAPSDTPTYQPVTSFPTPLPSDAPTDAPSHEPTSTPTADPTDFNTTSTPTSKIPTSTPISKFPTPFPTKEPTRSPETEEPTSSPVQDVIFPTLWAGRVKVPVCYVQGASPIKIHLPETAIHQGLFTQNPGFSLVITTVDAPAAQYPAWRFRNNSSQNFYKPNMQTRQPQSSQVDFDDFDSRDYGYCRSGTCNADRGGLSSANLWCGIGSVTDGFPAINYSSFGYDPESGASVPLKKSQLLYSAAYCGCNVSKLFTNQNNNSNRIANFIVGENDATFQIACPSQFSKGNPNVLPLIQVGLLTTIDTTGTGSGAGVASYLNNGTIVSRLIGSTQLSINPTREGNWIEINAQGVYYETRIDYEQKTPFNILIGAIFGMIGALSTLTWYFSRLIKVPVSCCCSKFEGSKSSLTLSRVQSIRGETQMSFFAAQKASGESTPYELTPSPLYKSGILRGSDI